MCTEKDIAAVLISNGFVQDEIDHFNFTKPSVDDDVYLRVFLTAASTGRTALSYQRISPSGIYKYIKGIEIASIEMVQQLIDGFNWKTSCPYTF
jgi:hypothetical protein